MEKQIIRVCRLIAFLLSFGTNLLAPALIAMRTDFGICVQTSGLLLSSFFAGNLLSCLLCGWLTVRLGKLGLIRLCVPLMAVFGIGIAASPNFIIICMMLFCLGVCCLLMQVTCDSIPTEFSENGTASSINGVMAYHGLGACAGLVFSGFLLSFGCSWKLVYLLFAVFAACIAWMCFQIPKKCLPKKKKEDQGKVLPILRSHQFWLLFPIFALYSGGETGITSWLVTYLVQERAFTAFMGSAVSAIIWMSIFVGRSSCEKLTVILSSTKLEFILLTVSAFSIMLIPFLSGIAVWIFAFIIGLGLSGIWPIAVSKIMDHSEFDHVGILTTSFTFSFIGNTAVPYVIGSIAEKTSMSSALVADGSIYLLMLVLFGLWVLLFHKKLRT